MINVSTNPKRKSSTLSRHRRPSMYSANECRQVLDNEFNRTTRKYRRAMRVVKHQDKIAKAQALANYIDGKAQAKADRLAKRFAPRLARRQAIAQANQAQQIDKPKPIPRKARPLPTA